MSHFFRLGERLIAQFGPGCRISLGGLGGNFLGQWLTLFYFFILGLYYFGYYTGLGTLGVGLGRVPGLVGKRYSWLKPLVFSPFPWWRALWI